MVREARALAGWLLRLEARLGHDVELGLLNGLKQTLAHQRLQDLAAGVVAVVLLEDGARDLALAEAFQVSLLADVPVKRVEGAVDICGRDLDLEAAL